MSNHHPSLKNKNKSWKEVKKTIKQQKNVVSLYKENGKKKPRKKIDKTHPEFELTYDMMLGIRTTVGKVESKPWRELTHDDFTEVTRLRFLSEGTNDTPAHQMRDFKFKDYCPEVFRHLRERFNVSPADYLTCVCGNFDFLEFISNSKSGQFFFYTHDRQMMIKTVSPGESRYLRKILRAYYQHVMANPNTLLTRIFGMHRVKPHKKQEVHFLIFGSVFYTSKSIHSTFDLKGSTRGRFARENEVKKGNPVWKDNDLVDQGVKIRVGARRKQLLLEQIQRDVDFLRDLNIMDYSLLLGIHRADPKVVREKIAANAERAARISAARNNSSHRNLNNVNNDNNEINNSNNIDKNNNSNNSDNKTNNSNDNSNILNNNNKKIGKKQLERRGSGVGVPDRYNQVSVPGDINFVAPEFGPVEVVQQPALREEKYHHENSLFTREDGGIKGLKEDGTWNGDIYYMGIIDILTIYGVKKRMESGIRTIQYDAKSISAVNPYQYADRFKKFIDKAVV